MRERWMRVASLLVGAAAGYWGIGLAAVGNRWLVQLGWGNWRSQVLAAFIGAGVAVVLFPWLARQFTSGVRQWLSWVQRVPAGDIVFGLSGLVAGLLVAVLLTVAMPPIPWVGAYLRLSITLLFGYLGVMVALRKKDEWLPLWAHHGVRKQVVAGGAGEEAGPALIARPIVTAGTEGVVATTPGVTTVSGVVTVSGGRAAAGGAMAVGMADSWMASASGEGTAEAQAPAVAKPASSRGPASLNIGSGVAGSGGACVEDRVGTASMTGAAGAARMGGTVGAAGAIEATGQAAYSGIPKLLDTSAIIDGRIADVAATGFLEGPLVIPGFVIAELQRLADSADVLKRNRGRRGLDLLGQMRKDLPTEVVILEDVLADNGDVDLTLVRLARHLRARVVTNDYNLNKVARLHGVGVLNLNDLANAVKPVVLPGEEMEVRVLRDGKEQGQGVGYLDDGTMIVIDGGREYVGHLVTVLVTSVLQTSAGRMIFARPKGQVEKVGQASNA